MRSLAKWLAIALLLVSVGSVVASADDDDAGWVKYDAKEHGFSMLVPTGTKFTEKEYGGGWGELWAEHEGIKLYGLAKKNEVATADEIEKIGVKLTGIASSSWKTIYQGKNKGGWKWYKTVEASKNGKLVIADYGVGSKSSYLLVLITTEEDYQEYKADYVKWYESIVVK